MLRKRTGRQTARTGLRSRIELLESRLCLSVTVTSVASAGGTDLKIVGDNGVNTILIADQGNGHVDVTNGGGRLLGSADNVKSIQFNGKNGQDTVTYSLVNPLTHAEKVTLDLGTGKDQANIDLSQGVSGAKLDVTVNGGQSADVISAVLGNLTAAKVDLAINGGAGNDNISVTGTATTVDADSVLRLSLDGGDGKDTIAPTLDSQVLGKLVFKALGGQGADTITTSLTADPSSTGTLRAVEKGGKGVDSATLNVYDNSGGAGDSTLTALHAKIFDESGADTLTYTDNVTFVTGSVA